MIENELAPTVSLDGVWQFAAEGVCGEIVAPGCWEAQGYPKTLDGPVRYRRTLSVPAAWAGQPIVAEFDAVSYAATVSCNGHVCGRHLGLWTPFAVELTPALRPGAENVLEVEVTKPCHALTGGAYPMRTTFAGFLPDVATTFGGLWQSVRLRAVASGFDQLHIAANLPDCTVQVRGRVVAPASPTSLTVQIEVNHAGQAIAAHELQTTPGAAFAVTLPLTSVIPWSPTQPAIYTVTVQILANSEVVAFATRRTGFRRLTTRGQQIFLNDEPICLRGVLSWGWNPAVIAPFFSADQARAEMRKVRDLGFNLIKLCLFIPNQTYYDVADEEGMLLWQEWPMWLPEVTPELRARAPAEYVTYMDLTRGHPAVVVYSLGCELDQGVDRDLLQQLDGVARGAVEHVLFCDNSGSGEAYGGLAEDFADFTDYHTYGDLHYLEPTLDHWRRDWQRPRPWIFGEFCDSDGFRDRARLLAANGGQPPWWMTADNPTCSWRPEMRAVVESAERLAAAAPGATIQELLAVAAAQSLMVRKVTLEAVRQRSAVQGYVITGLIDTPITTSGVLDDFGAPKWPPALFRRANDAAILCLDVGRSRTWQHGGDRPERLDKHNWWAGAPVRLHVILNHTAPHTLRGGTLAWQLCDEQGQVLADRVSAITRTLEPGTPEEAGVIEFIAPDWSIAQAAMLAIQLESGSVRCANQWSLWIYPHRVWDRGKIALYDPAQQLDAEWKAYVQPCTTEELQSHAGIAVTTAYDAAVRAWLQSGGRALLLQTGAGPLPARRAPFWREALKLLTPHPLWQRFPQRGFADLQFWGLATDTSFDTGAFAAALPELEHLTPILRRLDAREFTLTDYLFAATVGAGRLVACALRLQGGAGAQPTGLHRNVAGHYLLAELLQLLDNPG